MNIQITGEEEKRFDFAFRPIPKEHLSKVRRAVGLVERIIRECKHCTQRKKGMIGLHAAFGKLKCIEYCGRSKHKPKPLETLASIVWVSYDFSKSDYGQTYPCRAPDELAVTNLVMKLSDLHIAGTIIHEMAHLASGDIDKNSHQAESVLKQCCRLKSVYNPKIMGKISFPPRQRKPKSESAA